MLTRWCCIGNPPSEPPCSAGGEYDHTAKNGDSGPAFAHTRDFGHATNSHSAEWSSAA